jgi:hypothetical protein
VPDVEQASFLARPVVRVDDAQVAVLHGHHVSAKGHEFGAVFAVELIQIRSSQLLFLGAGRGISHLLLCELAGSRSLT